jgi:3-phenylpropionate/trans-cinnamate dioxygenase ferredoxin component
MGRFLGEGEIDDAWNAWAIESPVQGSAFDVRTGAVLNPPAPTPLRTYPVEVEGEVVKVSTERTKGAATHPRAALYAALRK